MCGEHPGTRGRERRAAGSSPHVRGARPHGRVNIRHGGIIPACAGSTRTRSDECHWSKDHPRMCGEHKSIAFWVGTLRGSSPHVRGALPIVGHVEPAVGIIPACAGSTQLSHRSWRANRDHPRMCGEHTCVAATHHRLTGSSPHVRGAPATHHDFQIETGIIPACAGSTSACSRACSRTRDHPRMCGEHCPARPSVR